MFLSLTLFGRIPEKCFTVIYNELHLQGELSTII